MLSTGRKVGVGIGMAIFALGLLGPLGVIGIGFGVGLVIGSLKRNDGKQLKVKKHMTAKENSRIITTVLPITTNNRK